MSQSRRTKRLIDSCVQGALARRIIIHWLVFLCVVAAAAFVLQILADPFRPISEHAQELWWTHGPFLLVMVFLLPVFIIDTVKISHRFAGPVYSLRRAMRDVANGKRPRKLKFRKHDFWHDLAEDYNAMLSQLNLLEERRAANSNEPLVGSKQ